VTTAFYCVTVFVLTFLFVSVSVSMMKQRVKKNHTCKYWLLVTSFCCIIHVQN